MSLQRIDNISCRVPTTNVVISLERLTVCDQTAAAIRRRVFRFGTLAVPHLGMTRLLALDSIASWLELRMSQQAPLRADRVRLMGILVVDPLFADSDTAARTTWIGDALSIADGVREWHEEFHRFDAVAAVGWASDGPDVTIVIVNP